ncbi:isocitrate lyase [Hymenobacter psychrotolerans]|uniref:Isocitrate lyase n=1 Tax=Hymenobacter psychrotolerans DSM 18569 TaxID=1121959 RepID=A0A1M6TYE4_9BACT|nr:isocitrate lyase [Hymenobacter psychrotolerans]SHK62045.1 isocitrate lyase [Hymenobacter psychrotolerans DSM 18569]
MNKQERIAAVKHDWTTNPRWKGIKRPYSAEDVVKLQGSVQIEYSLARQGAERLWNLLHTEEYVAGLGALTGNQAVQEVQAGLNAIYLSGWQVAADANGAGQMYPDQSLYPADSVPAVVKRINNALLRADQIQSVSGEGNVHWLVPIVADAEAGFGGNLNAFELMKQMIEAGAAGVHFEDQLSSAKKCGHLGGKVLVPTQEAINKLVAARLAADVQGVPTLVVARTDADAADLLTADVDPRDQPFILQEAERTSEGFFRVRCGVEAGIARGLAYAPYADLIWMETSHPDLEQARQFADAIHAKFPGKLLAYNCSPSFNWAAKLSKEQMQTYREELAAMGYKFQFITLAGFHALNTSMFELALAYRDRGMAGYSELQEREFALQQHGFKAVKHQSFVGTGYFDAVQNVVTSNLTSTAALVGSTEEAQF